MEENSLWWEHTKELARDHDAWRDTLGACNLFSPGGLNANSRTGSGKGLFRLAFTVTVHHLLYQNLDEAKQMTDEQLQEDFAYR